MKETKRKRDARGSKSLKREEEIQIPFALDVLDDGCGWDMRSLFLVGFGIIRVDFDFFFS